MLPVEVDAWLGVVETDAVIERDTQERSPSRRLGKPEQVRQKRRRVLFVLGGDSQVVQSSGQVAIPPSFRAPPHGRPDVDRTRCPGIEASARGTRRLPAEPLIAATTAALVVVRRSTATNTNRCNMHGCCRYPYRDAHEVSRRTWTSRAARVDVPEVDVPVGEEVAARRCSYVCVPLHSWLTGPTATASGSSRRRVLPGAPAAVLPRHHRGNRCARFPTTLPPG